MSDQKNPVTPLTPDQTAQQEQQAAKEGYAHREAVALDVFVNETLGGPMGETISSRAARAAVEGKWWGIVMSKFLNLFQKDHGAKAVAGDLERAENLESVEGQSGIVNKK